MDHSSSTLAQSAMVKESSSQMKVGSVFRRRIAEYGSSERYAAACVMERDSWDGQSIMVWPR